MTINVTDLILARAPGCGLPYVVLDADRGTVAAFLTAADRDDYITGRRKHGSCAVSRDRDRETVRPWFAESFTVRTREAVQP